MKKSLIGLLIMWICGAIGIFLGLLLAYTVQFQWRFFGATLVDVGAIIGLWSLSPLIIGWALLYLGAVVGDKIDFIIKARRKV